MLKERFKVKIGVLLVLFENDQVLLSRRYNTGIADGQHVLPMGGLEDGETITQAIIRETFEETNLILEPQDIKLVHVMHRFHLLPAGESFPQVDLFFTSHRYVGEMQNKEPHKCDELKFYPVDSLPSSLALFARQALRCIREGSMYSEIGWDLNVKSKV